MKIATCLALLVFALTANTATAQTGPSDADQSGQKRYYFIGTVGTANKIQMELVLEDEDVSGSYYYDKRGLPLWLSGSFDKKDSSIKISEKGEKGLYTGVFNGKVTSEGNNFAKSIKGEWSNITGDKKLPFELTKVSDYEEYVVSEGSKIESKILYPKLLSPAPGLQMINTELSKSMKSAQKQFIKDAKEFFSTEDSAAGWQEDRSYSIAFYSGELLSLIGEVYSYTGGAHGNTGYMSSNYRITGDEASLLKLSDLFKPGTDYIKVLSKYCIDELLVKKAGWVVNGELTSLSEEDLSAFALSPEGIKFAFAPYAVGSYAEGPYFVTVPFHAVSRIIDHGGPLGIFLN